MAGKKKITRLAGSTKKFWFSQMQEVKFKLSFHNVYAVNQFFHQSRILTMTPHKYLPPGFTHSLEIKNDQDSELHLIWLNGYEKKYNFKFQNWTEMLPEVQYINHMVEFERSMQGFDDEYDDHA